ncbi:HAMP domain-containing methyl-accepting chemotaxis protein [Candidatus Reidiella endopervernicosa]|uniref:Methyl-accepting chemotaxis protein n=1 Tax=Candidatus Reidiella endopervernicosa TaxID=2738883 RepID=A0A6N0HYH1_9GAMM|nr:methyl-accepting chemotaxis protein [Candidatus Reidiella endopervernicosa]QKQ27418.1 methyl-accepting chemotaxis protein [Candidatus Reidiella endopervernicosa]
MASSKGNFFSNLQIRHKLWAGFGLVLAILVIVGLGVFPSLVNTEQKTGSMVLERQPAAAAAQELAHRLERSLSALGFYLLGKEEKHKQNYLEGLKKLAEELEILKTNQLVTSDPELSELLINIDKDVAAFAAVRDRMITLATTDSQNFPGIAFAGEAINPVNRQIQSLLSEMILSEEGEEVSEERRALLIELGNLRNTWTGVINGVRAYLAFRSKGAIDEATLYLETTGSIAKRLQEECADMLTFEQEDGLAQFIELREQVVASLKQLEKIHGGKRWRTDAYLINTSVNEMLERIDGNVDALVNRLREDNERTGSELLADVEGTKAFLITLLLVGLLLGVLIAFLMARSICRPIQSAVVAMEDIAKGEGDLSSRLQLNIGGELGQLSDAFNLFIEKFTMWLLAYRVLPVS